MKRTFILIFLLISHWAIFAQTDYTPLYNSCVNYYSDNDFQAAAICFEKTIAIAEENNTIDSTLYYYAAYSYYAGEDYQKAIHLFDKCILFNYQLENSLYYKADCYKKTMDFVNAEQSFKIGISLFPNSTTLLIGLINVYLVQERHDYVIRFINLATSKDPYNAVLYFALGATYETLGNRDLAYDNYIHAISIDENYFDAHYNLGVYYFNQAVELYKETDNIPLQENKKYNDQMAKVKLFFMKSLPFLENCYRIQSTDETVKNSLSIIYKRFQSEAIFNSKLAALNNGTLLDQLGTTIIIPDNDKINIATPNITDTKGPVIALISPNISRGFKEVVSQNTILVQGTIVDESGILLATLNGAEISLDNKGQFKQNVMLISGLNTINIQALDIYKNKTNYRFIVEQNAPITSTSTNDNPRKVALVIGNGSYPGSPLRNATNDAKIIERTLKEMGFEVTPLIDASILQMKAAVSNFGRELEKDKYTVGLFYYAGHGLQVKGKNYLIPVDAQIEKEPDVAVYAFDLDGLLANIEFSGNAMNIIILDACRNNPFTRSFRSLNAGGLAQINAPSGTIIAFATAPGSTASDGSGANGLYTQELVKAMQIPNIPIETVFKKVRTQVKQASNGYQIPWENSSLEGDFYFKK